MLYEVITAVEDDPLVYPIPDDIYLKATTPQPGACTLGDYLVKCYAGSEIPLDDGSTLNLGATECGNWIIAKVVNSRITSYNVCYTKLLRHIISHRKYLLPLDNFQK